MSPISLNLRSLVFAAALSAFSVPAFASVGNIVFLGDSITQGKGVETELSYRYSLWKCFVDNNEEWKPQGSMTIFNNGNAANPTLTPDYLGKEFDNRNEGHYGWDAAWIIDGNSGSDRPNTGQKTGGLLDWMEKYSETPNTATVLIGVNDLSRGTYTNAEVISNVKNIVTTLQSKNPEMTVHVFSLLPSAQARWNGVTGVPRNLISEYNKELEVEVGKWSAEKSNIQYHDITKGFDPTIHTVSDKLHPNIQGALIVSGNIARALGIGQRTVNLEQRGSGMLTSQTEFSSKAGGGVSLDIKTAGSLVNTKDGDSYWSVNSKGDLVLNTAGKTVASDLQFSWGTSASTEHELTLTLDVKMSKIPESTTNFLSVWVGNGVSLGMLYIGEDGIYWGDRSASNLLYGQTVETYKDGFMTADFQTLRIVWRDADEGNGIESGFYVWLGGQLIGEGLTGNSDTTNGAVSKYKNSVVIGDSFSSGLETYAEVANIAFDANKAWAPTSAIPEPSAFGLLAGIGALALVAARRRRNK